MTKENKDILGYYESVTAVIKFFNEETCEETAKAICIDNDYENGNGITFGDVLDECKKNGYKDGIILLILESFLSGKIYRYGNYRDNKWYEVGEMRGFA